ncbi:tRNA (cytidine/uridine-2'-O-)-methyltransferase [Geoalkalibacter ferrihydriticus]|uniref:Putative tRNA (cytidine(34)-2'-O)-methyltransferase n=2 Tax=Geoalkalibacter ferrihydriticus TaxID=392333 RepID=A0A0C2EAA3_9BACT|nr:tRNA (cytidine(34)-2'-O)-methyltransferase [Geoalkalibacter ferrihydriticus]KIH75513.1 tRNA methyltransferase [Geoalkalibacter ferrihydriticus DSM 17813]SDM88042.1 tRNA (cytidine/uridine-2'-O-)-methyltransferase [Geoalkalibacter ferrihydriticus]
MTETPFHIVLIEPEIPPNTGNIARLCGATGTLLHLVGKLGFSLDDRYLKRAGLDYWPAIDVRRWESYADLQQAFPQGRFWLTTKKAARSYHEVSFQPGDFLVFGKETQGLPDELLAAHPEQCIRIPIFSPLVRSLNLSTATGIVLYEALRQAGRLDEH